MVTTRSSAGCSGNLLTKRRTGEKRSQLPKTVKTLSKDNGTGVDANMNGFSVFFHPDRTGKPAYDYTTTTVPDYLRRKFIHSMYRAHLDLGQCARSIFAMHNETFDIWSHGIAAIIFIFLAVYAPLYMIEHFHAPAIVFCLSHAFVFSVSFFAHTFNPISEPCHVKCFQLDWSAISFAMIGCGTAVICYCFFCDEMKIKFYTVIYTVPCFIVFVLANTRWFIKLDSFHKSLVAGLPMIAGIYIFLDAELHVSAEELHQISRRLVLPTCITLGGISLYALKLPERLFPGKFDLLFNSHNFHHTWSTAYALVMFCNIVEWSRYRETFICPNHN
mmetsp:Transcript_2138/g.2742  ORF Transcript_2138/g.2742 Transcript_2138/m.2742 type:complete len:331 (-) Transcript_2138:943-1935(-)